MVGSLIVAVLGGGLAEQHGLFIEEDVATTRPQSESQISLILRNY